MPRQARREYFFLGAYLFAILTNEIVTTIGYHVFRMNMNAIVNLFSLFFYTFIILHYKKHVAINNSDIVFNIAIISFLVFAVINIFLGGITNYSFYTWATSSVIIVGLSLFYFYHLLTRTPLNTSITQIPMFWINVAVSTYYASSFLVFIFGDYLVNMLNNNMIVPLYIHFAFGIVYYIMLAYALMMIRREFRS